MQASELKSLRIDRSQKRAPEPSRWATRWIIAGVILFLLAGAWKFAGARLTSVREVEVFRVASPASSGAAGTDATVVLNATGYVVAAHKIALASKVVGRVAWIGVEKGDRVREGQVIVRLEDDEYRAQLQQARGQLTALNARLLELQNGSRPEEVSRATAEVETAKADLTNNKIVLDRTRKLATEGVLSKQAQDDAEARYEAQAARVRALERSSDLVRIGPRQEQIAAVKGQIEEAKGRMLFAETQLANTIIRAPVSGTILERNVEKGEFVTTGFVGDKGAKGYVVSMADLNDLEAELDINQNDFNKLGPRQKATITTDAYPDRKYEGVVDEISPEANRQKATVQVKVKVQKPDEYLRPEMNANVAFLADGKPGRVTASKPVVYVPVSAVRDDAVFVVLNGRVARRPVKVSGSSPQGLRVEDGLIGGEELVANPPQDLKEGDKVQARKG